MVKIELQIKANLENVTDLLAFGEDFRWYLKLRCLNCGEIPDKWQYVTLQDKVPLKGSRGEASFVSKCKLCSRENSLDIVEKSVVAYTAEDTNQLRTIVTFDCRGLQPEDFSPRNGWTALGLDSGTKFKDINLEEKEWVDYDEKAQVSVGIYEFEHKFNKALKQ